MPDDVRVVGRGGPVGEIRTVGRGPINPGGITQPDNGGGFMEGLKKALPLLAVALAGMKNPAAGAGLAQGLIQRREQDELERIRREELGLRAESLGLDRELLTERHRSARASEALAQQELISEQIERDRQLLRDVLSEDDPDIAEAILGISNMGRPLDSRISINDEFFDRRAKARIHELTGQVVDGLVKGERTVEDLEVEANTNRDIAVQVPPSLARALPKELQVAPGRVRLYDLLVLSGRSVVGKDGNLVLAVIDAERDFMRDFAASRGYTSFSSLPGRLQAQATREFEEASRAGSFNVVPVNLEGGQQGLARVNANTGQVEPVQFPAGMSPAGTSQAASRQNAALRAMPVIDEIDDLSRKINTVFVTIDPATGQQRDEGRLSLIARGVAARLRGTGQRLESALNANPDVRIYTDTVEGFAPLLARALGHSGVLTEQDVARTIRVLPIPGESREVRDAKIAMLRRIMNIAPPLFDGRPESTESSEFQSRLAEALAAASDSGDATSGRVDTGVIDLLERARQ